MAIPKSPELQQQIGNITPAQARAGLRVGTIAPGSPKLQAEILAWVQDSEDEAQRDALKLASKSTFWAMIAALASFATAVLTAIGLWMGR
jgi:hypothetical protein